MNKGFTLAEILAVVLIFGIIIAIAIPNVIKVVDKSKESAFESSIKKILNDVEYLEEENRYKNYILKNQKLYKISNDNELEEIYTINNFVGEGLISFSYNDYSFEICNENYCASKTFENDSFLINTNNEIKKNNINTRIIINKEKIDTSDEFSISIYSFLNNNEINNSKYIINRYKNQPSEDSALWDNADSFSNNYKKIVVNDKIPGKFYLHLLIEDFKGNKIIKKSDLIHVEINDVERTKKLETYKKNITTNRLTSTKNKIDFIQPYIYVNKPRYKIIRDLKLLKRSGYESIIIQNSLKVENETGNQKIKYSFYNTSMTEYKESDTLVYENLLDNVLESAKEVGLKVYIGGVDFESWWTEDNFKNINWKNETISIINKNIDEIYNLYNNNDSFKGFYFNGEMYTNNSDLEEIWSSMLNNIIEKIETKEKKYPLISGSFISSDIPIEIDNIKLKWENFIMNTNFRDNDIFILQDGLGIAEYNIDKVVDIIKMFKSAVDKKTDVNLLFGLITENYGNNIDNTPNIKRYLNQIDIASYYSDLLLSFSYTHFFNYFNLDSDFKLIDNSYDLKYREFNNIDTSNDSKIYGITKPEGGFIYRDNYQNEIPVPKDFTVSSLSYERNLEDGIVVKDKYDNEFVWIPVNNGIKPKGYIYKDNEWNSIFFTRFINNGITLNDVFDDSINDKEKQINKYYGFYVGRYESSFNYNNGDYKASIKPVINTKAKTNFDYEYVVNNDYDGYLWNNINYIKAKEISSKMSNQYNYFNVKTELINGTEWDTMLKWINLSDNTLNSMNDGRSWGNYTNSIDPSNKDNYEKGVIKPTGSNINWEKRNIYDVAGNLREWTLETNNNNKYVLRSNAFDNEGLFGSPAYGVLTDSYKFTNAGFRIVLYID